MNDYSGLSRHDRRAQARREAKLANRRLGSVEIMGNSWLIERAERNPEFAHWMAEWIGRLNILRPLCMNAQCTHEFTLELAARRLGSDQARYRRRPNHDGRALPRARGQPYVGHRRGRRVAPCG